MEDSFSEIRSEVEALCEKDYDVKLRPSQYGVPIWEGQRRSDGLPVILKYSEKTEDKGSGEAMFLEGLTHDNIIKVLDVIPLVQSPGGVLVLPRRGVSSKGWIPSRDTELVNFFFQLYSALLCCHENRVIHNDVKPSNVLFDAGHIILIDFGLSVLTLLSRVFSNGTGGSTLSYSAPETLVKNLDVPLSTKIDCWSSGVMLAELLLGKRLWNPTSAEELAELQRQFISRLSRESFSKDMANPALLNDVLWEVLAGCLCLDPARRMSSAEAFRALERHGATSSSSSSSSDADANRFCSDASNASELIGSDWIVPDEHTVAESSMPQTTPVVPDSLSNNGKTSSGNSGWCSIL